MLVNIENFFAVIFMLAVGSGNTGIDGANILGIFPGFTRSHYIMGQALFVRLAQNGHNLTLISQYKMYDAVDNIEEVKLDGMIYQKFKELGYLDTLNTTEYSSFEAITNLIYENTVLADLTMKSYALQNILKSNRTYDLLILDMHMVDSLLGIANYYQIPSIIISPTGTIRHTDEFVGNPFNPSYNPHRYSEFSDRMCLKQRLINTITAIFDELSYHFMYIPSQEIIYHRYFNEIKPKGQTELPPLIDLVHNVSLVFVNSHKAINYPRAFVPNMIEVGGLHIKNETYIAKDAEKFMNESDGVIFFSLGTKIKSKDLPDDKRDAFVNVFARMGRLRIFWKWENATLVNQSDNIVTGAWLPQQDFLGHPTVKLFITHGGLLSEMEGVYFRKPMIGIPVTDEDRLNVIRASKKGYMRMLDYNNITEESIREAINDVMNNPSYQEAVNRAADLFQQNAIHPLENAVYLVEYVLKTQGAHHLRTSVVHMPFWKYLMIDVTLIIVAVLLLIVSIPFVITLYILRRNYNTRTQNEKANISNGTNNNTVVTKNKNSAARDKKNVNKLKHH